MKLHKSMQSGTEGLCDGFCTKCGTSHGEMIRDYRGLKAERDRVTDALLDCFAQATYRREYHYKDGKSNGSDFKYDHGCLSAYEDAQELLIELGLIKAEECSRK